MKSFHFRAINGTAVAFCYAENKAEKINMLHYGKEVIQSHFTSFITPKGSPLQVERSTI